MDLATSCTAKLVNFRVRELKDILTQLGLSKQGKKQDLIDRILSFISDEQVSGIWAKKKTMGKEEAAKLVEDVYRKMQGSEANDLSSKGQRVLQKTKLKNEDTDQMEKVRCPCGSSLQADSMIKCEDCKCNVWQHIGCVIIPEKPMESILPPPRPNFYCELCRLVRADPFWVTVAHPLYPVKLNIASVPTDGTNPVQSVEKIFQLTRADRDLLAKPEYDIQAWCMLLNDKVYFRMQWPQYANLQINGVHVRAINRPGSQLLGANGRDDGAIITQCTRDGINKISLTGCDARVFCLGVRIVKRRTVQQILNIIPKESEGERFEDALSRVLRCVGGGAAKENAESDSDLEIVADSIPVNLRCPMSGSRMKIAGRFKPCAHMGCFDLEIFVEMNQRSRKWQCPICLKNYCLEDIIIDPYFTRITNKMRNYGEDLTEIEVKPDGCWRVKADNDRKRLGDLAQWHLPDGTLCVPMEAESKPKVQALKHMKQEGGSEGHTSLKLGIKKNINGVWELKKPENLENLENGHNVFHMSSSGTSSINQENNGVELDSLSMNIDPEKETVIGETEFIILSDTEEEPEKTLISSGPVHMNSGEDDFRAPFWGLPSGSHERPSFQLFGDGDHDSYGGPSSMEAYRLINDSYQQSNGDVDDGLVDNPLAFGGDDWISLGLGGDAANGLNSRQETPSKDGALGSLADTASMILESQNRSTKTSRKGSDGPFSFPRQKRSVRPKLCFSIASDSDEDISI